MKMKKEIVTMLLAAALMTSSLTACTEVEAYGNDIDNTTLENIIDLPTTPSNENEKNVENPPAFSGIYADVLEQFRQFLLIKKNYENYTTIFMEQYLDRTEIIGTLIQAAIDMVPDKAGYCIKDINGDGLDELILLDEKYHIYALFTIVENQIKIVDTFWGETNHTGAIGSDGIIYKRGYGKGESHYGYAQKISTTGELVGLKFGRLDDDPDDTIVEYYRSVNGEYISLDEKTFYTMYYEYDFVFNNPTDVTKQSGITFLPMLIS